MSCFSFLGRFWILPQYRRTCSIDEHFFGSEFSKHPEGLSFSGLSFSGLGFLGPSFSGLSFRDTRGSAFYWSGSKFSSSEFSRHQVEHSGINNNMQNIILTKMLAI